MFVRRVLLSALLGATALLAPSALAVATISASLPQLTAMTSPSAAAFSPLSTFYDIDVSTTASFFAGKAFGPGCARGGAIPDGFIAVAMNGRTMGLKNAAAVCGMCIAIRGPSPTSANPADNQGIVGEYYAYVYEVCEDCTQTSGVQLGIPGVGQSSVVWRAIPCPTTAGSAPFIFFDGAKETRARFQIRGLSSPIVRAVVNGNEISTDGPFFVLESATSVFPFTMDIVTALNEQLSITVPAFREYGALTDLITISHKSDARPTSLSAPMAQSQFGTGEITTISGAQSRTVKTTNQVGRQILTISTCPHGAAADLPASIPQMHQQQALAQTQQQAMGQAQQQALAQTQYQPLTQTQQQPAVQIQQSGTQRPSLYAGGQPELHEFLNAAELLAKPIGIEDFGVGSGTARFEQMHVNAGGMNQAAGGAFAARMM